MMVESQQELDELIEGWKAESRRRRCQFGFPLQCVYRAHGDETYCLSHYQGKFWAHFKPKEYERLERYGKCN